MLVRGLKANIAINIAVFLLVAGFGANLVTTYIYNGILLSSESRHAQDLLAVLTPLSIALLDKPGLKALGAETDGCLPWNNSRVINLMVLGPSGQIVFEELEIAAFQKTMVAIGAQAMAQQRVVQKKIGFRWRLTGLHYDFLITAASTGSGSSHGGACVIMTSLEKVNQKLSRYQRGIFFYILINTFVLAIIALYRLFKIYLRPVDRLVQQAERYNQDDEVLFAVRREDNELGKLSAALNSMLNRISQDKQKLTETVASLEKANRRLKKAQQEIVRAEKMASVGRLAAGIAHEIGNPIGIVLGYLELLKEGGLEKTEQNEFLSRAESEIQRINRIIRQLLDLSRPAKTGLRRISVHGLLDDMAEILSAQPMMAEIRLDVRLTAAKDNVLADEERLRQVFLNLFLNAADAIAEKIKNGQGIIQVVTTNNPGEREDGPRDSDLCYLTIEIRDNGAGISEENIKNVFDPFFSTKAPGKGTGLGLAVSYMIIEQFGGSIRITSEAKVGSTVTVNLPIAGSCFLKAEEKMPK